jgi:uncharacterized membrane protein HdeD (DUF308 family)
MYAFLRWHSDLVLEDLRRRIDEEVAAHRGWYVFEGILFLVIGLLAVLVPGVTALAAQYVVGALLLLGGAMRLVNAFRFPRGRWWRSISGVLFIAAGGAMIWWPLIGLSALILAIGALLVVEGVLDILLALTYRPAKRWGWLLAAGIASIILGFLIYAGFPLTGVIYLALAIGISMGVYGASILLLAVNAGQEHEKEKAGAAS